MHGRAIRPRYPHFAFGKETMSEWGLHCIRACGTHSQGYRLSECLFGMLDNYWLANCLSREKMGVCKNLHTELGLSPRRS